MMQKVIDEVEATVEPGRQMVYRDIQGWIDWFVQDDLNNMLLDLTVSEGRISKALLEAHFNKDAGRAWGNYRLELCMMAALTAGIYELIGGDRVGLWALVTQERAQQDSKWGQQNHHPAFWLAILFEEVGEVVEGVKAAEPLAQVRREIIQVIAVVVAAVECLGRNGPPEGAGSDAIPR